MMTYVLVKWRDQ